MVRPEDEAWLPADVSLRTGDPWRVAGLLFLDPVSSVGSRVGYLCCVNLRHTTLVVKLQGLQLHYPVHYGLVINAGRGGADGWLFSSSSQLTSIHKVTGLRHCRGKIVSGGM